MMDFWFAQTCTEKLQLKKTNVNNLAKVLMDKRDMSSTALRRGHKYEAVALKEFEKIEWP